jgi:hypothetical protein
MLFVLLLIEGLCRNGRFDIPPPRGESRLSFDKQVFGRYEFHSFNDRLCVVDDARA